MIEVALLKKNSCW